MAVAHHVNWLSEILLLLYYALQQLFITGLDVHMLVQNRVFQPASQVDFVFGSQQSLSVGRSKYEDRKSSEAELRTFYISSQVKMC